MKFDERADHDLGQLAIRNRILSSAELRRDERPNHDAVSPFHDDEIGADDGVVVAEQKGARGLRERLPELRQHPVFAIHVVRGCGDRTERGAPQHVFDRVIPLAVAELVGEIRVATTELPHAERPVTTLELPRQILPNTFLVESFVGTNVDQFRGRLPSGLL